MKGWHTQVAGEYERPTGVIGVVVAPKFPDTDLIREKIEEGVSRVSPETVWVIREKRARNHAVNAVWETLEAHGIQPFHVPLVAAWKRHAKVDYREHRGKGGRVVFLEKTPGVDYDLRRRWADAELGSTCERVIVFHDASSIVTKGWKENHHAAKVFVIERGKKRVVKRQGRKPVGA